MLEEEAHSNLRHLLAAPGFTPAIGCCWNFWLRIRKRRTSWAHKSCFKTRGNLNWIPIAHNPRNQTSPTPESSLRIRQPPTIPSWFRMACFWVQQLNTSTQRTFPWTASRTQRSSTSVIRTPISSMASVTIYRGWFNETNHWGVWTTLMTISKLIAMKRLETRLTSLRIGFGMVSLEQLGPTSSSLISRRRR